SRRARVSSTASCTSRGRVLRSFLALRVRRSSAKTELLPHLGERAHAPGFDVALALAERLQEVLVLQDLQCLLDRLEFSRRDQDTGRSAITSDDHMLMPTFEVVEQFTELG